MRQMRDLFAPLWLEICTLLIRMKFQKVCTLTNQTIWVILKWAVCCALNIFFKLKVGKQTDEFSVKIIGARPCRLVNHIAEVILQPIMSFRYDIRPGQTLLSNSYRRNYLLDDTFVASVLKFFINHYQKLINNSLLSVKGVLCFAFVWRCNYVILGSKLLNIF